MALRTSWEGFLKLSLITVPVRAYNSAVPGGGDVHFHQIHKKCGNRIHYQKVCPVHGEVTKDEIVSGYEYEKKKCVEVEPEEVAQVRAANDQSINIDVFVPANSVEPIYMTGRTFYLVPDGPAGQKPYILLHQVMKDQKREAVAAIIISGHEETVLLRPLGKLLTMTVLYYDNQIKKATDFEDEVGEAKITTQELNLAETLVTASTSKKLVLSHYKDQYNERIRQVIEAKLAGKKIARGRSEKAPHPINLMDALRKSVQQAHGKASSGSKVRQPAPKARRKTG
jgi:DNA end-binding protein Ku